MICFGGRWIVGKSRVIEFISTSKEKDYEEGPRPSSTFIPDWFKNLKVPKLGESVVGQEGKIQNLNVKSCLPFLDGLSAGYMISTPVEILVRETDGNMDLRYAGKEEIVGRRDSKSIPRSNEYWDVDFVWKVNWLPRTPEGYSVLITHPFNRYDLPFTTLSGIIDSDNLYHGKNVNLPFLLKKNYRGILQKGTPIYQIFPFKRDKWESSIIKYNYEEVERRDSMLKSVFKGFYKKIGYNKKEFK